jgi:flavin-dependent dehydrogenase
MPERFDVVVVGARCAGTSAAVPLARAGRSVLVLDKVRFQSDTLSTHVLVPNGVRELARMGALESSLALKPARAKYLGLFVGDVQVRERFRPVEGLDYGLCIPRVDHDLCFIAAARAAGAEVRERCRVTDLLNRDGRVVGVRTSDGEVTADLVIGADGRRSRVAAAVGAWQPYRGSLNGRGFAFRYMDDPLVGTVEHETYGVYRAGPATTLTLPASPQGRVLVVFMAPSSWIEKFRGDASFWDEQVAADPLLAKRLAGATDVGRLRSTDDLSAFYRRSSGAGWALVGDAGHFKDPVVGQGMREALRHGRLLGEAVASVLDDPTALEAALRRWEHQRDVDSRSTYHWGNRETRAVAPSLLVREVFRTFAGDVPDASDTFNRARRIEQIIGPTRLVKALAAAWRTPGANRRDILREVAGELPIEAGIRWENASRRFRYTGWSPSERPGWDLGPPPV